MHVALMLEKRRFCIRLGIKVLMLVKFLFRRCQMFLSSQICLYFLVTCGEEVTKIRKYDVIFFYILQGKMGKTEKTEKNHATKVTKIPKTKRPKMWDERNKKHVFCNQTLPSILLQRKLKQELFCKKLKKSLHLYQLYSFVWKNHS